MGASGPLIRQRQKCKRIKFVSVLPCADRPPPIEEGGWLWYDKEFSKYKCPNGKMFENGNFPFWYSNCTVEKVWDPAVVEECIRKYKYSLES